VCWACGREGAKKGPGASICSRQLRSPYWLLPTACLRPPSHRFCQRYLAWNPRCTEVGQGNPVGNLQPRPGPVVSEASRPTPLKTGPVVQPRWCSSRLALRESAHGCMSAAAITGAVQGSGPPWYTDPNHAGFWADRFSMKVLPWDSRKARCRVCSMLISPASDSSPTCYVYQVRRGFVRH
jgi:hypothetical protein